MKDCYPVKLDRQRKRMSKALATVINAISKLNWPERSAVITDARSWSDDRQGMQVVERAAFGKVR